MGIVVTSSLLGLVINHFNPNGIPLLREKTQLVWVSDSLFNSSLQDPLNKNTDSSTLVKSNHLKSYEEPDVREQNKPEEKIAVNENQTEKVIDEEKSDVPEVIAFEPPKNITIEQAYSLFNNDVTFIDARDEAEYLAGYISRSINIPYYDFENHQQKLGLLSIDKPIVTYCAGTDCDLSILLANQLSELGYKQVYIFFGGWIEWQNANYPTELPLEE
jgi:rhodanese-related sulfurtransferase